jgi:hypothetical protein
MSSETDTITSGTDNAELVKRIAAALAKATAGRASVVESKKTYKRPKARKEIKEIVEEQ